MSIDKRRLPLRAGHGDEAVETALKHVDILHRTMFMGLSQGGAHSTTE
jgi:hypothetical protein